MFNKLYENIKKYIKENYKFLIFLIILFIILNYPVPYYIYNGGGTISLSNRIKINNEEEDQNFYMCYVGQMKANLMTLGLSYVLPNIDREKIENEDYDEEADAIVNNLLLQESQSNSIINAFNKAGKKISINSEELYISYIYDEANTDLAVGDKIKLVDDAKVNTFDEFSNYISLYEFDDEISLEVEDINGKKKIRKAKIVEIDGEKKIGVGVIVNYGYKTEDEVEFEFKGNESGPSGGFMMSLAIYDILTDSNLSADKKICGTGTITKDGEIGEIGGVKYKLAGAVDDDCDIFLVPSGDNYNDATLEAEKNNYDIDIYEAKSFDETVLYLQSIE